MTEQDDEAPVESLVSHLDVQVVNLAQVLSISGHVSHDLIRAARLDLLPSANAATEAQLWFSDLVLARGADGILLQSSHLPELRAGLVQSGRLHAAILLVERLHRSADGVIRLEDALL